MLVPEIIPAEMNQEELKRKRWTHGDVRRLESLAIVKQDRYELPHGQLFDKRGKNRPHTICLYLLIDWLGSAFPSGQVQQESSIDVSDADNQSSESEPDASVLSQCLLTFNDQNPGPPGHSSTY